MWENFSSGKFFHPVFALLAFVIPARIGTPPACCLYAPLKTVRVNTERRFITLRKKSNEERELYFHFNSLAPVTTKWKTKRMVASLIQGTLVER